MTGVWECRTCNKLVTEPSEADVLFTRALWVKLELELDFPLFDEM